MVLVLVQASRVSVPRDVGTWLVVFPNSLVATIGGGRLELDAIAYARALAHVSGGMETRRFSLGPSLGQCCGGGGGVGVWGVCGASALGLGPPL